MKTPLLTKPLSGLSIGFVLAGCSAPPDSAPLRDDRDDATTVASAVHRPPADTSEEMPLSVALEGDDQQQPQQRSHARDGSLEEERQKPQRVDARYISPEEERERQWEARYVSPEVEQ